jgi:carbonic anhydrase
MKKETVDLMEQSYQRLIDGNRHFSLSKKLDDPEYFKKLSLGQRPDYLWIGCSDSRVPANEVTGTESGEIFVHRNIANLVVHTDLNLLSVLEYALVHLGVRHVIVCGHYGCGGVRAAMENSAFGIADNWLRNIKDVFYKYGHELNAIDDRDKRADRLTELNVIEQVRNLAKTTIVQNEWKKRPLHLHGWVYGINSGLITDLSVIHDRHEDIEAVYRYSV